MKIEEIEAMINDFSELMLNEFKTNQKDFKALTVQKVFNIIQKRKLNPDLAKTKPFWDGIHSNMELFKTRVVHEINHVLKAKFTDEEKTNYFFDYLERNTED